MHGVTEGKWIDWCLWPECVIENNKDFLMINVKKIEFLTPLMSTPVRGDERIENIALEKRGIIWTVIALISSVNAL